MKSTVLNYIPRESFVHRLCGTTKLLFLIFYSVAVMVTYDTRILVGLTVAGILFFPLSKVKVREVSFLLYFIFAFLFLNVALLYLFNPDYGTTIYGTRTVLFQLFWRYDVTAEELFYLFNFALKYFAMTPVAVLFIAATNPSEFASSLNAIGVPYSISYAVSLALRYIPDIQRDYHSISQAQQARGVELGKKEKLSVRMKNSVGILLPLILSSFSRIDVISNAMELRGFGKKKKRTWYVQRKFRAGDWAALGLGILLMVISILVVYLEGSRFYNPFAS